MCILSVTVIAVGGALIVSEQLNIIDRSHSACMFLHFVNPVRKLSTTVELIANGTVSLHRFVQLMRTEPALKDDPDADELQGMWREELILNMSGLPMREIGMCFRMFLFILNQVKRLLLSAHQAEERQHSVS